jgi:hypothetical protein
LGALRGNLPDGLEDVIATAMERDLDARYASMDELADALRPYQSVSEGEISVRTDLPSGSALLSAGTRSHIRTGPGARSKTPATGVAAGGEGASGPRTAMVALGVVALLAAVGGGAAIALSSSETSAPPVAAVAPTPVVPANSVTPEAPAQDTPEAETPEPPPAAAAATTYRLHIESDASGARAVVRGRVLDLPYDAEIEARSEAELIEVSASRHQSLRFLVTMDQVRSLRVNLPRGSGLRDATDAELEAALNGGAPTDSGSSSSSRSRSGSSRSGDSPAGNGHSPEASAPAPTPMADPPPSTMANPRVYSGPAGDLPTL